MPSFDVVSKVNMVELRHAVDNTTRVIETRFDFRGVTATVTLEKLTVTVCSESEFQVKQLEEIFRAQCAKRNVPLIGVEEADKLVHSGKCYTSTMVFKEGLAQPIAKDIAKYIKDMPLKVQVTIQGDQLRVSGKKRDDLQQAIALLKKSNFNVSLQFENFREN